MTRANTFVAVLAAGALAAGCGGDDDTEGDANRGDGTVTQTAPETRTTDDRAAAVQMCLEQARRIPDAATRRTVVEACRAGETGDTSAALESARKQCIDNANGLPDGDVRDRVREACERIPR